MPSVSLGPLEVGSTAGIMCTSHRTLHFFVNHKHVEIRLSEGEGRLPHTRYAVVDLYGQCSSVVLKPAQEKGAMATADVSISVQAEDLLHVKRSKVSEKRSRQEKPVVDVGEPAKPVPPQVPVHRPRDSDEPGSRPRTDQDCDYYKICRCFLNQLSVPGK